ncbi:hypothetical protein [Streptomyces rubiginosohelvolus]
MDTQALALALPLIGWASHTALLTHRLATAHRDPLTGLRTRAGWTVLAERVIRRHRDAVVLLLDLDHVDRTTDG